MIESVKDNDDVALDELFEILADQRRRYVLICLRQLNPPLAIADLAEEVAAQENDKPAPAVPSETVERTCLSLHHVHIPRMEEANVVHFDQDTRTISLVASKNKERSLEILDTV